MTATRSALALGALLACACSGGGAVAPVTAPAATSSSAAPVAPSPATTSTPETQAPASPLAFRIEARPRAPYARASLGPIGYEVAVHVRNASSAPVDVGAARAVFQVTRNGVPFRCGFGTSAPPGVREPKTLAPGSRFTFRREVDCAMPLPGPWAVRVAVAFAGAEPIPVGEVAVHLDGAGPPEHPTLRGLHATALGNEQSRALGEAKWLDGGYTLTVAFVNGSAAPRTLEDARAAFRVTKVGTPLACMDEPVKLTTPLTIPPGVVWLERVPITCIMHTTGSYDIVGSLIADRSGAEVPLGLVRLQVSSDPQMFAPPRVYP